MGLARIGDKETCADRVHEALTSSILACGFAPGRSAALAHEQ
jgi:hypothetical protein